ncbi:MAG: sigma-70 family RNA polymerase sigma factor [Fuerstiella sp.]
MRDELENLYRTHRQGLFSFALSLTGCRQQAEDAVHAAFAKLCASMPDQIDDLKSYVFACVRNAALDALRTDRRTSDIQNSLFEDTPTDSAIHKTTNPENELNNHERNERLGNAVDQLGSNEREVVVMKIYSGLTFDEIGRVLEQPAKTVATRYRRALLKLEEKLRGKL